jgi:hypothetical protein
MGATEGKEAAATLKPSSSVPAQGGNSGVRAQGGNSGVRAQGGNSGVRAQGGNGLRWIEPEVWGFRAWSCLFGLAAEAEKRAQGRDRGGALAVWQQWLAIVALLPQILPCPSCRRCCARFLAANPPEQSRPVRWLARLRRSVQERNAAAPDASRLEAYQRRILAQLDAVGTAPVICTAPTDPQEEARELAEVRPRFLGRALLGPLWVMDTLLFLACVALTVDPPAAGSVSIAADLSPIAADLSPIAAAIAQLAPHDLGLAASSPGTSADGREALEWLLKSRPLAEDALARKGFIGALAQIRVGVRDSQKQ